MFRKPAVLLCIIVFSATVLLSCGIEEYYFLPQIPEGNIYRELNTEAVINIPPIPDEYYYAGYYAIFYRIYTSNHLTSSPSEFSQISPNLSSDYNFLLPYTNPANTSSIISANIFKNRNFFELEFEGAGAGMLPKTGGTLRIIFPTAQWNYPIASFDSGEEKLLRRSSQLISPEPRNDLYFRNTPELRNAANAINNINADVAGRAGEMNYTYVSMYIVAVGTNPSNFTSIYSKPAFISVFKLPDTN